MGYDGSSYLLRPIGGGLEWICPPNEARQAADDGDKESAR